MPEKTRAAHSRGGGAGDGATSTLIAPECSGAPSASTARSVPSRSCIALPPDHRRWSPSDATHQRTVRGPSWAGEVGKRLPRAVGPDWRAAVSAEGSPLELAGVAVRDVERAKAAGMPASVRRTDAPAHLVADPAVDAIVEVMGGDEPAGTLVRAALAKGQAVVTANKHLIAEHGPELEAASRAADSPLRFEASVGGGIPVLAPLALDLAPTAWGACGASSTAPPTSS